MKIFKIEVLSASVGCANRVKCEYTKGKHCRRCRENGFDKRGDC